MTGANLLAIAGDLSIDLQLADKGRHRASISSRRPLDIARLYVGKTPEQLVASLPRLFSVCGVAQARTVMRACAHALQLDIAPERQRAQDRLVAAEMLREHALRVLMGWNRLLHLPVSSDSARLLTGSVGTLRQALFAGTDPFAGVCAPAADEAAVAALVARLTEALEREIFGESLDVFLSRRDLEALAGWAAGADTPAAYLVGCVMGRNWSAEGASAIAPLPSDDHAAIADRLAAADASAFVAHPLLAGTPHETSALTRNEGHPLVAAAIARFGRGLLARLVARLVEIARLPALLLCTAADREAPAALGEGRGIAATETARGRLVHYVQVLEGRIADIRILAPTEWNFHPLGVVAESLRNLSAGPLDEVKRKAELIIETIDPCVGYELRLAHA
jgi:hypothetical protein